MKKKVLMILCAVLVVAWLSGCATTQTTQKPYRLSSQGTVIWEDEFEFAPPPLGWKLLMPEEGGDINIGFMRMDPGPFPSLTTFAYDEEPFGCSPQFEGREKEFFKRFLFNAILQFQILERKKVQVVGWRRACRDGRRERSGQEGEGQSQSGLWQTRGTCDWILHHPVEAD